MPKKMRRTKDGNFVPAARWTRYGGEWMRSRLEACWAEAFDANGWHWSYEPQRFTLGNNLHLSYLPDFWLPAVNGYAEVKPVFPDFEEITLVKLLAEWTRLPVYFLVGKPWVSEIYEVRHNGVYCAWQLVGRQEFFGRART